MRYFFDTEFLDTGDRIHLISVGIAAEDGRTYYAEALTASAIVGIGASDWVLRNVCPHLEERGRFLKGRDRIAAEIREFVGHRPEFWAYVADYDWVALSQLYGSLINRPEGWPWTALDTYQLPDFKKYVVKPINAHNALADAIALKKSWLAWREAYPDFPFPTQSSPSDPGAA